MPNQDWRPAKLTKRLRELEILIAQLRASRQKDRNLLDVLAKTPNPTAQGMSTFMMLDGANKPTTGNWTFGKPVLIDHDVDAEVALTVQASPSPAGKTFVVEDSTGTDLFTVDHSGSFTATQGSIVHTTPSSTVFNLVAAAAQSANIFNILDSALSNLLNVQSDGKLQLIAGGAINEFSTDGLLAGNSDLAVPTEKAVKTYVDANSGGSGVPTGSILAYGSTTAPTGFLKCDGAAVSRATYAALFAIIGTTFGPGDGSTTFNVPDLNARSPMGAGAETGLTTRTIGNKLGAETNTHNHSGGAHTHTIPDHNHGAGTLYALIYDDGAGSLYSKTTTDLFSADRKSRITAQVAADSEGATDILGNTASKTGLSTNQGSGTTGNASPTIVHPVQVVQYIIKT